MVGRLSEALRVVMATVCLVLLASASVSAADLPPAGAGAIDGLPPERVVRVKVPPPAGATNSYPFKMGFEYSQLLSEDGDLAYPGQSARALGLHFVFLEGGSVRQHFAIAHQWERLGASTRQGFRFDLLALGFPIPVFDGFVRAEIEPVLRPLRGQIMFEDDGAGVGSHSLLRLESGFALGLRLSRGIWFVTMEPLSIDFRTVVATQKQTRTGFSRVWSMALIVGRDF